MICLRGHLKEVKSQGITTNLQQQSRPQPQDNPEKQKRKDINTTREWEWTGFWAFGNITEEKLKQAIDNPQRQQQSGNSGAPNSKSLRGRPPLSSQQKALLQPFSYKFSEKIDPSTIVIPSLAEAEIENSYGEESKTNVDDDTTTTPPASDSETEKDKSSEEKSVGEKVNSPSSMEANSNKPSPIKAESKNEDASGTKGDLTTDEKNDQNSNTIADGKSPVVSTTMEKITFASNGFQDAGKEEPDTCPVGGSWNGYFQNPTKRKDRPPTKIDEHFYLFFNSNPPPGAKVTFETQPVSHNPSGAISNSNENSLLAHHVHVRGMGNNCFGTFELIGYFDTKTSQLICYRMYIAAPTIVPRSNSASNSKRINTRVRSRSFRINDNDFVVGGAFESKKHFTRKKKMSWQRSDSDPLLDPRKNSRKRSKSTSDIVTKSPLGTNSNNSISSNSSFSTPNKKPSSSPPSGGDGGGASIASNHNGSGNSLNSLPGTTSNSLSTPKVTPKSSRPLLQHSQSLPVKKSKTSHSSVSDKYKIVLPKAGSEGYGIWRAAHFIFYQHPPAATADYHNNAMTIPSSSSGNNIIANTSTGSLLTGGINTVVATSNAIFPTSGSPTGRDLNSSSPTNSSNNNHLVQAPPSEPIFCVYEGEMNQPGQRDGRGVCLYPNKYIFEGHFKKNREHGKGVLMSGDRKRVIYDGDWERGRMHGKGRYYYYTGIPEIDDDGKLSYYDGDFKENARHGLGLYMLRDGSFYDGEWRDNVQSGRGSFTWTDGSQYVGLWKNGKRNGHGILSASDGFKYDGQWNNNTMEGRGIGIYPNGQRYEG